MSLFVCTKRVLVFRELYPSLSKWKIQGTYFKIGRTFFKIQGTYFSAPEKPAPKNTLLRRLFQPNLVVWLSQIACLCPADSYTPVWRRSGLRLSRAGRQITAEVRKLAKWPHLTLLFNSLMTVLGLTLRHLLVLTSSVVMVGVPLFIVNGILFYPLSLKNLNTMKIF